ncbi:MAG: hypothetical protein ABIH46_08055, partial [Chloroflexota bacterium]
MTTVAEGGRLRLAVSQCFLISRRRLQDGPERGLPYFRRLGKTDGRAGALQTARRSEVAVRIQQAKELAGTANNAEYDEAKNEQAFVEGRIRDLDNILSDAVVAPTTRKKGGGVAIGDKVTVVDQAGSKRVYTVVGSAEAAP